MLPVEALGQGCDPSCQTTVLRSAFMAHDTTMLHVYGYPRDGRRYFVGNPRTVEEGIQLAEDALKDRRRGFTRAEVRDVHGRRRDFAGQSRSTTLSRELLIFKPPFTR